MGQEFVDIPIKQAESRTLGWLYKDEDRPPPLRMGKSRMMAIKCMTDRVSRHRDGHLCFIYKRPMSCILQTLDMG
jgi:hypothetical protein